MSVSDLNILKPNYCHRKKGDDAIKAQKGANHVLIVGIAVD